MSNLKICDQEFIFAEKVIETYLEKLIEKVDKNNDK